MRWRLVLLSVLLGATASFGTTAIVRDEGGPEYRLVIKPAPGPVLYAGGGEEGAWAGANPGQPLPWWLASDLTVLASDSIEGPGRLEQIHLAAWLLTVVGWLVLGLSVTWIAVRGLARRWPSPRLPARPPPFEFQ